jgi:hypothetical protein
MLWVRRNRQIGAWAALFAFALQIVLSFGHVHVSKPTLSSASVASMQLTSRSHDGLPRPGTHTGADDFCAICATMALVASSVVPQTAALALPVAVPSAWPREFETVFASLDAHFLFQARAPPFIG